MCPAVAVHLALELVNGGILCLSLEWLQVSIMPQASDLLQRSAHLAAVPTWASLCMDLCLAHTRQQARHTGSCQGLSPLPSTLGKIRQIHHAVDLVCALPLDPSHKMTVQMLCCRSPEPQSAKPREDDPPMVIQGLSYYDNPNQSAKVAPAQRRRPLRS